MTIDQIWHDYSCRACARFRTNGTCEAFPAGIPLSIASNQEDHFSSKHGDAGLTFALAPSFRFKLDSPAQTKMTNRIHDHIRRLVSRFKLPRSE